MCGYESSYAVVAPIRNGFADDMVLNPTLDILSVSTNGGWNYLGENRILFHLNFSSIVLCRKGISGGTWCNVNGI